MSLDGTAMKQAADCACSQLHTLTDDRAWLTRVQNKAQL
jgi:hypothetical protein